MKMNDEKFKILKQIENIPKTIGDIYIDLNLFPNWHEMSNSMQILKRNGMVTFNQKKYPPVWEITNLGKEEIEHWEREGTPGELF